MKNGSRESHSPSRRLRALVVDDDPVTRDLFSRFMGALGHDPVTATCGDEALTFLREDAFDIVITDVCMAGMSGWQIAEKVQHEHPGAAVIVMSGFLAELREPRAGETFVVLTKPVGFEQLKLGIERALALVARSHRNSR